VVIFLILLRKIKKITTHSLFYFAAKGGEILLRQPQRGGDFWAHGGPAARHVPFPGSSGAGETDYRVF
jgi:hypothetical protein